MGDVQYPRRASPVAGLFVLLIAMCSPASAETRVLVNSFYNSAIYDLDTTTGSLSDPRPTGIQFLVGIAFAPDGILYGLSATGSNPAANGLYRININTGASERIGPTGLTDIFEGDLFVSQSGELYGLGNGQGSGPDRPQLFRLSTTTGQATVVGAIKPDGAALRDVSAGTFAADGTLHILDDYNNALLTVNPTTAQIISSRGLPPLGLIAGMAFDPLDGNLWIADGSNADVGHFQNFNLTTGTMTPIGSTWPVGIAGMTIVPEPRVMAVVFAALLALQCVKRPPYRPAIGSVRRRCQQRPSLCDGRVA